MILGARKLTLYKSTQVSYVPKIIKVHRYFNLDVVNNYILVERYHFSVLLFSDLILLD